MVVDIAWDIEVENADPVDAQALGNYFKVIYNRVLHISFSKTAKWLKIVISINGYDETILRSAI